MNSISIKVIDWLQDIRKKKWQYSRTHRMKDGYADCASAVSRAYKAAGVTLKDGDKSVTTSCYEVYADQFDILWPADPKKIGKSMPRIETLLKALNLQGGEHIFMNTDSDTDRANKITHITTVLPGGTHIIHMRNPVKDCCIDPISYCDRVCAVARYNGAEGADEPSIGRMLKYGCKGEDVKLIQAKLKALGFFKATIGGNFLLKTQSAVRACQKAFRLKVDGVVGEETTKALGLIWKG